MDKQLTSSGQTNVADSYFQVGIYITGDTES